MKKAVSGMSSGFSIMELLIVTGILSVVGYGIISLISSTMKAHRGAQAKIVLKTLQMLTKFLQGLIIWVNC